MSTDTDKPRAALLLEHITQRFGALLALDDVSAVFVPGRVHGVLGENGAGKSTLMRIAAGLLAPTEGLIGFGPRAVSRWTPAEAAAAGVAMVHQHFMLVPSLTAAENCVLGRRLLGQWHARRRAAQMLRELGLQTGLQVDPDARIETLSVGERQRVEILRALSIARRVLILDEPTAVLAPQESEGLFQAIEHLKRQGLAIAFISHKLGEVARICDDLTILRRGRCVYSGPARDLTPADMARHMIGESAANLPQKALGFIPRGPSSEVNVPLAQHVPATDTSGIVPPVRETARAEARGSLELVHVTAGGPHPVPSGRDGGQSSAPHPGLRHGAGHPHSEGGPSPGRGIREINLTVRPGEIVGIAGVEGNGQDVLAAAIVGLTRVRAGTIRLAGRDVTHAPPRARSGLGLAHIAEDRLAQALVPGMSLTENLALRDYRTPPLAVRGLLRWPAARRRAAELIRAFDVRTSGIDVPIEQLSGGNQQKVVLARELSGSPAVILAHNPVRGLDIAATQFVFDVLLARRDRGAAILLIHSDLDELLALADRLYVLYAGRCIPTDWPDTTREHIGRLMLGAAS